MRIVLDIPDQYDARIIAAFEKKYTNEDGVKPVVNITYIRRYIAEHLAELVRKQEQEVANLAVERVVRIAL